MKLKQPINSNYAAIVVEIKNLVKIENCDNVQHAIILGNSVVVSNEVKQGDIGIYFPLECKLSNEYLKANNLYRKAELNEDSTKKGYFEENGRIRCVKFRGNKSEGLFMPIESVSEFLEKGDNIEIGNEFDELNGVKICEKYVVRIQNMSSLNRTKKDKKPKISKIIDGQFRFHEDTSMLYKNLDRIKPNDIINISYKIHGTSGISSYVLCKKPLNIFEKTLKKLGVNVVDSKYDYLYSSRKVIKNEELNPNAQHFYNEDIWGIADKKLRDFLQKGMTFYYEICGFLPYTGGDIQKGYDYGCGEREFAIYIYRITTTNVDGKVFEYSAKQVQDFCKQNGLNAVPELYYGYALDFVNYLNLGDNNFSEVFLQTVKDKYNEKDCFMCKNIVPEEGCVIRIEKNEIEAYKAKSNRFYERETKMLDKNETNLEDEN